jgi:hypothetical protein
MFLFDTPLLALGGLVAAAGPVVIHLLNRRRFRVVSWGAMDFLRAAMERQRKALELRDLLLLLLRMLAVVLVGCALAKPYLTGTTWGGYGSFGLFVLLCLVAACAGAAACLGRTTRARRIGGGLAVGALTFAVGLWGYGASVRGGDGGATASARVPVHAVIVVDNSRSMGVASTAGTRLDRAKLLIREFVEDLPPESRITLLSGAGSETPPALDAYVQQSEALRALEDVPLVDAGDDPTTMLEQAELACARLSDPPTKRVVVVTDLQAARWRDVDWAGWSERLEGLQVAPVSEGPASNVALVSLELEDRFAGAESDSRFLARITGADLAEPTSVEVALSVAGTPLGGQVLELEPGQTREVEFPHRFDVAGEPGRPQWTEVTVEVRTDTPGVDRLAADNSLSLLVPVLDAVPVVFIDEYGEAEDPAAGKLGETYALRHLLAPNVASDETPRRLIQVTHVRPDEVTPGLLETARLVVVAGVEAPEGLTTTLREYAWQGGPVVILAGGAFDPAAWQEQAWLDGRGLLPVPLEAEFLGTLPTATTRELTPFYADVASLIGRDFQISDEDPELLAALFEGTPFFQAVRADVRLETLERLAASELALWTAELTRRSAALDAGATQSAREPTWWAWRSPLPVYGPTLSAAAIVERETPRVLAKFTGSGLPWVVERPIGRGQVILFTSGVTSDGNLLRSSGAMYVFHRMLFRLIAETLPTRNAVAGTRLTLPYAVGTGTGWELIRPSGRREPMATEALDGGVTGFVVRRTVTAGRYTVQGTTAGSATATPPMEAASYLVQGDPGEAALAGCSVSELRTAIGGRPVGLLSVGEPIRLTGGSRRGEGLWSYGILGVLLALLGEMVVLAAPLTNRGTP